MVKLYLVCTFYTTLCACLVKTLYRIIINNNNNNNDNDGNDDDGDNDDDGNDDFDEDNDDDDGDDYVTISGKYHRMIMKIMSLSLVYI